MAEIYNQILKSTVSKPIIYDVFLKKIRLKNH